MTDSFQKLFSDFSERSLNTRSRRQWVSTASKKLANLAHVDARILGARADPNLAFGQFFKEDGCHDAFH
jgi:hypothetical protein